jgi:hypothetical protein
MANAAPRRAWRVSSIFPLAAVAGMAAVSGTLAGCNAERKAECDRFMQAMRPLSEGTPTTDAVHRVESDVAAIHFEDQALGVYAKNYTKTLTILSTTLELKAGPTPPDGTDDVIKTNLKEARTDAEDTARYCAQ